MEEMDVEAGGEKNMKTGGKNQRAAETRKGG